MGSCDFEEISYANQCSAGLDTYEIIGLCQNKILGSDVPYCSNISPDEWTFDSLGGACGFNLCSGSSSGAGSFPCCGNTGCCNGIGRRVNCQRTAFLGAGIPCCLLDLVCDPQNNNRCFDSSNHQHTCNPNNRDITTTQCQDNILQYCTGADLALDDVTWLNRWNNSVVVNGITIQQPCLYAVNRNLYNSPATPLVCDNFDIPGLPISSQGFGYVQNLLSQAYNKYKSQGFVLGTTPGSVGFNEFQNVVLGICKKTPGACVSILRNAASGLTTNRLTVNPTAAEFFGCYLPDIEYANYVNNFQISRQCTSICNRSNVIPLVGPDGITITPCANTVCLIDNIAITLAQSQIGNITFSQVCGGCGSNTVNSTSSCSCIIENNTIDVVNSKLGGINIQQNCQGAVTQCVNNQNGVKTQTPCSNTTNPNQQAITNAQQAQQTANTQGNLILIFTVILVLVVVFFIYLIFRSKK